MDELLDLVNEKDEVIGEVWRSEAHQNNKIIHREIGVMIYNNKNQILLQQRSKFKNNDPLMWTIACAGHVTKNKSPEETAHIELKEELGFDTKLSFYKKSFESREHESRFNWWYIGEYNGNDFVVQKEEVEEARFFSKEQFEELVKTDKVEPTSADWCREFWGMK